VTSIARSFTVASALAALSLHCWGDAASGAEPNGAGSHAKTVAARLTVVAGKVGGWGYADRIGGAARFGEPSSIAILPNGTLVVSDTSNSVLRTIDLQRRVTTLAGRIGEKNSVDGPLDRARFQSPQQVVADRAGNLFVLEAERIRRIGRDGTVSTPIGRLAAGRGRVISVDGVSSMGIDDKDNLYLLDGLMIRKISPQFVASVVTELAAAIHPLALAVKRDGTLYVADTTRHVVRVVTPDGRVRVLAGAVDVPGSVDGPPGFARLNQPVSIAATQDGRVYVTEANRYAIRRIEVDGGVSTIAGQSNESGSVDGSGANARFGGDSPLTAPRAMAVDGAGALLVADNHTVRRVTAAGAVSTVAGTGLHRGSVDGIGEAARFWSLYGVASDRAGNLFVADRLDHTVRKISPARKTTTLGGASRAEGSTDGPAGNSRFNGPTDVAVDKNGVVYVADTGNNVIRRIAADGTVTTVRIEPMQAPQGVAVADDGTLYVSDTLNHVIRRIAPDGVTSIFAGSGTAALADGQGPAASFNFPMGLRLDAAGNLYVADSGNSVVRKVTPGRVVTTLPARFKQGIRALAVGGDGVIYVADTYRSTIQRIGADGAATTIAGTADVAGVLPGALPGGLNRPSGLALFEGALYIADLVEPVVLRLQLQ
jgi:sugar lactone lactonase YvrE